MFGLVVDGQTYFISMTKLGYTFYPKDWGNSEKVFILNLEERGLYRELIDLAFLNDNKTEINYEIWSRKFNTNIEVLKDIITKLSEMSLLEIRDNTIFISSCESRLNMIRGGSKGGKKSKKNKGIDKGIVKGNAKGIANQKKIKRKENKIYFTESEIFDKVNFKKEFPEWGQDKLSYYYEAALRYSNEGNRYIDWLAAVRNWARKDELSGKIKFNQNSENYHSNMLKGTL